MKIVANEGGPIIGYAVRCPACEELHCFNMPGHPNADRACWVFDGNEANPTFNPSMLVHYPVGHAPRKYWDALPKIGLLWSGPETDRERKGVYIPAELAGYCELTVESVSAAIGVDGTFDAINRRVDEWAKAKFPRFVCHSYVRGGTIEFLDDCTHELRGQTVSLPEL